MSCCYLDARLQPGRVGVAEGRVQAGLVNGLASSARDSRNLVKSAWKLFVGMAVAVDRIVVARGFPSFIQGERERGGGMEFRLCRYQLGVADTNTGGGGHSDRIKWVVSTFGRARCRVANLHCCCGQCAVSSFIASVFFSLASLLRPVVLFFQSFGRSKAACCLVFGVRWQTFFHKRAARRCRLIAPAGNATHSRTDSARLQITGSRA